MLKVFVYGTLKPGESNYQSYCEDKVVASCAAWTWGELYDLPIGYPGMVEGKDKIYGVLLTFAEAEEEVLKDLDTLEDYQELRPEQENNYQRKRIEVFDLGDRSLGIVWAYFLLPERVKSEGGILIHKGWWGKYQFLPS